MFKRINEAIYAKKIFYILATFAMVNFSVMTFAETDTKNKEISSTKNWETDGGIKVMSIRRTAADYMLDFRYKVIDSDKAYLFMDRKKKPYLHVLKNGKTLQVPNTAKIGPLRQSGQLAKVGKTYFMFFGNPGRMVKSGDKVQIQIGDFKSEILSVE